MPADRSESVLTRRHLQGRGPRPRALAFGCRLRTRPKPPCIVPMSSIGGRFRDERCIFVAVTGTRILEGASLKRYKAHSCSPLSKMSKVLAVAAVDSSGLLKKIEIDRRSVLEKDVDIEIKYSGICHSDLHQIRAEWMMPTIYPMVQIVFLPKLDHFSGPDRIMYYISATQVPGHEIVGIVRGVGSGVTKFKVMCKLRCV